MDLHNTGRQNLDELPDSIDRVVPLGDLAPNACPKCQHPMELAQVDDHLALLCQACKGLLFQSTVLAQIIQQRRKKYDGPDSTPNPLDPKQLQTHLDCPGCGQTMDVHPYHGPGNSVIDSCFGCGFTFLDYGELSQIEKSPGQR